jgi:guanylate kinase
MDISKIAEEYVKRSGDEIFSPSLLVDFYNFVQNYKPMNTGRKTKRIILAGHAASGKDYLAEKFIERGFRKDISMTTRPMRDGEVDGKTYHYVSKEEFMTGISDNLFFEYVEFNKWWYGTSMEDWDNADVFIMTPSGISQIPAEDRKDCVIVFIDIPERVRVSRINLRSDADTTERRIKADRNHFAGFIDYDYRIINHEFDASQWISILSNAIKNGEGSPVSIQ